MPFVRRDQHGNIDALFAQDETSSHEWLPGHHPSVLTFLGDGNETGFAVLDTELIRVIEDLTDTLINKGLLRLTDLPHSAQVKLLSRKGFRERAAGVDEADNIFGGNGVI